MVGILIVTHGELANELLRTAQEIVGKLPRVEAVSIHAAEHIEKARKKIEAVLQRVNDGNGVLILTDLFGGTPSNLVLSYLEAGKVEVVTGVNLPMLMKLPSLREERDLRALADKLARYGQRNILVASEFLAKQGKSSAPEE
ncbi:MAG TPA: PTS fructose transporter subunit IIA [Candidatus Methylomirabilis sp.]|nr:PTS fructose transporter subunit IIA [Candidatus Methylomirabilis sp.]